MRNVKNIFCASLILFFLNINTICVFAATTQTNITDLTIALLENAKFEDSVNNLSETMSMNNNAEVFKYGHQNIIITPEDIELMAKLIAGESIGEPYTGKVAVASVVLNRVTDSSFPNTIHDVIFQKNAFSCVHNNCINSHPNDDCYKAVYEAINGKDPTNKALFFYNPTISTCNWMKQTNKINQLVIGHHTFFKVE